MSSHRFRRGATLAIVFAGLVSFESEAIARNGICSTNTTAQTGCVAYEHEDFQGNHQDLGPNRIYNYVGGRMNDAISSFRVAPGCRFIAWEHRDRGGASKVFETGDCQYVGDDWNDRISSWECRCTGR
jgi:hypothetical protein